MLNKMKKNHINLIGDISKPCPCGGCKKKGCGAYHSICGDYINWNEQLQKAKITKKILKDTVKL